MNKINYHQILLCIVIALAILVSGCSSKNNIIDSDVRMNIQTNQEGRISRIYDTFSGFERGSLETKMDQTIFFDYEATVNNGSLIIEWQDPNGSVVWRMVLAESGGGNDDILIKSSGRYTIVIQGKETSGNFSVSWNIE